MEGIVVYALLNKKLKSLASGISNIVPISNGLRFTTTSGSNIDVTLPTHTHSNLDTILEKFTLDVKNQLLFDGQSLDKQIDLTNYVVKETGKGLFSGNYNDLINKPASQQPNKPIIFTSSDWVQDLIDTNKYTLEITHGLKTIEIIGVIYNINGDEATMGFKPVDIDRVMLTTTVPIDGRVVLNYSSTISTNVSTGITDLNGFTSDNLAEGTNNKYLTPSEKAIVSSINLTLPTDKQVLSYDSNTGKLVNDTINDEKVKMSASDTNSKYISELLDNVTIQNINGQLVCKNIDGVTVGITNINTLQGMTENIKSKFDALSNAMKFTGTVSTKADLNAVIGMISGDVKIVLTDESNLNKKITYVYDGTSWHSLGEFNITVRNFSTNPIQLGITGQEVIGTLPQSNIQMDGIIKTTDIIDDLTHTDINKPVSANQAKVLKVQVDTKTQINDSGIVGNTTDTYSVDKIITLLNNKQNKIFIQSTQPVSPSLNTIWIDTTNSINYIMKAYNGTGFVQIGSSGGITIEKWSNLTSYTENSSFVIYNGLLYKCKITHISTMTFETANWDLIGGDVTKTGTETLTNKSLVDSSTKIIDEIDNTKIAQFECGGISTGTSRTYSLPNKDGTIALLSDIPMISDKTTSGYFDIGTMRIQWGKVPSGVSSITVNLPAPFANNTYNVTANCNDNTAQPVVCITIRSNTRTTTSFVAWRVYANTGGGVGGASEGFEWFAIGQRP